MRYLLIAIPLALAGCYSVEEVQKHDALQVSSSDLEISSQESVAFDRYTTEELNCAHEYLDPVTKANAAIGSERERVLEAAGLRLRGAEDQKAIDERLNVALNRLGELTPEQLHASSAQFDDFERKEEAVSAWTGRQLDALDKCRVDSAVRLKTQLWGDFAGSSHSHAPMSWAQISSLNDVALNRYDREKKSCGRRFSDETRSVDWAASSEIIDKAIAAWVRCDTEAAARLKSQLWSP